MGNGSGSQLISKMPTKYTKYRVICVVIRGMSDIQVMIMELTVIQFNVRNTYHVSK